MQKREGLTAEGQGSAPMNISSSSMKALHKPTCSGGREGLTLQLPLPPQVLFPPLETRQLLRHTSPRSSPSGPEPSRESWNSKGLWGHPAHSPFRNNKNRRKVSLARSEHFLCDERPAEFFRYFFPSSI